MCITADLLCDIYDAADDDADDVCCGVWRVLRVEEAEHKSLP